MHLQKRTSAAGAASQTGVGTPAILTPTGAPGNLVKKTQHECIKISRYIGTDFDKTSKFVDNMMKFAGA
jgi:hypothetical protein